MRLQNVHAMVVFQHRQPEGRHDRGSMPVLLQMVRLMEEAQLNYSGRIRPRDDANRITCKITSSAISTQAFEEVMSRQT